MSTNQVNTSCRTESQPVISGIMKREPDLGEARLLLEALQVFTQASSSLETAFQQLQQKAQSLSQELERKNQELEKSLREKEEVQNYLKTILESLPCGVLVLDERGTLTLANSAAEEILSFTNTEPSNPRHNPEAFAVSGLREYLAASLSDSEVTAEVEIPLTTGKEMRVFAASGTRFSHPSGRSLGSLHIIRDITEMKSLEEQSKRGERLSAMGEMALELAHEIRNPLGSIELFASLLEKELPRDSDLGRWAENIHIGSRSLDNIVSNMLHFANPLSPTFTEVDLHQVIQDILSFADPIMRQREVCVRKHLKALAASIYGDRELLKQMILNLILNSMQAMPARGSLDISTRDTTHLPGGVVCAGLELKVKDTGLGIPPEHLTRIFDPFFTTNKNGTGLGLSVVHQIVEKHSGFIQVESEVNIGTTFTITLPSARLVSGAA